RLPVAALALGELFVSHAEPGFLGLIEAAAEPGLLAVHHAIRALVGGMRHFADRRALAGAAFVGVGRRAVRPVRKGIRAVARADLGLGSALVTRDFSHGASCH